MLSSEQVIPSQRQERLRISPIALFAGLIALYALALGSVLDKFNNHPSLNLPWSTPQEASGLKINIPSNPTDLLTDDHLKNLISKTITHLKFKENIAELNEVTIADINSMLSSKETILIWKKHNAQLSEVLAKDRAIKLLDKSGLEYEIKYKHRENPLFTTKPITLLACATIVFIISAYMFAFTPYSLVGALVLITGISFSGYNLLESLYFNGEVTNYELKWVYALLLLRNISYFSMLCIVAVYPRQCISLTAFSVAILIIAFSTYLDCFSDFPIALSNLIIFSSSIAFWYFANKQWRHSKEDPVLMAQLKSLLIIFALPCLLCIFLFFIPVFVFKKILLNQMMISVSFLCMWSGMVWMILNRNLFHLENYWFRLWYWSLAAIISIVAQIILTTIFRIDHVTALLASLLLVSWIFIPLSKPIWQQILRSRGQDVELLLPKIIPILVSNKTVEERWIATLNTAFEPLEITPVEVPFGEDFRIVDHGSSLLVNTFQDLPTLKLSGRNSGTRLFNYDDVSLLNTLYQLIEQAVTQEVALEESKAIERKKNMEQFAFLSHELRTPLTLILGPLEEREQKSEEELKEDLNIVHRNAKKLFQLTNQMLDFTRFQSIGEYREQNIDVSSVLTHQLANYTTLFASKSISLEKNLDTSVLCAGTTEYLNHIMGNLISNAIKYSPEKSLITLSCFQLGDTPTIELTDQGPGLSEAELQQIFQPFYRSKEAYDSKIEGSCIGLAVVHSLASKMGATISAECPETGGTIFHLKLKPSIQSLGNADQPEWNFKDHQRTTNKKDSPSILIVDDTHDMLNYLCGCLGNNYNVISTDNAHEAINILQEHTVDLVVSDVMMEPMDGYEFCKTLRNNPTTDHIPIILLTARADLSSKLHGLELGADEYLQKPFNQQELLSRIRGLIDTRSKLREKYEARPNATDTTIEPNPLPEETLNASTSKSPSTALSKDQRFLEKTQSILHNRYQEVDFSPSDLADDMAMSLRALQLKSKAILGVTPGQMIQSYRMKRAELYLKESDLSMSEISASVGIDNPAYFSRQFKSHSGMSPSAFRAEASHKEVLCED